MNRIDEFFNLTVELEGGFSNRASDRGGKTKYGITQYTLNLYCTKHNTENFNVADISLEYAKDIYAEFYFNSIPFMEDSEIHFNCIDLSYNSGYKHYVKMKDELADEFNIKNIYSWRENYYKNLNQPDNIQGWLDRLTKIRDHFNPS